VARGEELDALIQRAQEGDLPAFEALLQGHLSQVRRYARAFCADESDADDLAQEALVKVFRSLRQFRYQSAFSTWLYAVVRNVFLDAVRSRRGQQAQREEALADEHVAAVESEGTSPAAELEQKEERRRIWRALRAVPAEFRSALVLFDIEGQSYDEVAAIERVPVGTVKSRLSRGRAALRRLLEGGAGGREERAQASAGAPADAPGTIPATAPSNAKRSGA
jgi:RNA polymerase sigma-70 factor (ECF subfamily)